jgi:alpha-glucuronidase
MQIQIIPLSVCLCFLSFVTLSADDGYRLWLRYDPIEPESLQASYDQSIGAIERYGQSDTLIAATQELETGLNGLLNGQKPDGRPVRIGTLAELPADLRKELESQVRSLGDEGYLVSLTETGNKPSIIITANTDVGVLYGAFAFLRHLQTHQPLENLHLCSVPRIQRRLLNHWDNLTRTVERVQSGQSLWEWFQLPDYISPRYRDYARANASIGINGTVLTNVNANALVLTEPYLIKTAALADVFRPYGIRVYLTARFSAPMEIGGLPTADPLDPAVRDWWKDKVSEIYTHVPDFGGFLVKANSEGQPGPQEYGRNHVDGANMLGDALAPYGGIVMWRAFVYTFESNVDRHKQAYDEFVPLDGKFRDNVIIQAKNGPIDFMPREPFHPMFGAMPQTSLGLELQITQEYLGGVIHLAFLAPLFEEVLDSDTFVKGAGSTVGRIVDGSLEGHTQSVIAGVANIGTDRNWTGHPLAQANWYAFGRLAWDHTLDSSGIAKEWTRMTFSNDPVVLTSLTKMLLESREAVVDYSMPLGLHHIMASGHHYGPGPWVDQGRPDWTAVYYHRADAEGIGFDRTPSGTNALEQYAPEIQDQWGDPATIPAKFLLWFHHVPWDYEMPSGRTLWEELGVTYQRGVDTVRSWEKDWGGLSDWIDTEQYSHVAALLNRQEREAVEYKDACLLYFRTFSKRPWPAEAEPALHSLEYYMNLKRYHVPGDPAEQ